MKRRVAVRAIIVNDGKLFCVKLKAYEKNIISGIWCTVGGSVDPGEDLITAITREVIEETGVQPEISNLLYIQQWADDDGSQEHLEFFFRVTNSEDFVNVDLSKTTHGQEEIAEFGFVNPIEVGALPKFLSEVDLTNLENKPTQFFNYL